MGWIDFVEWTKYWHSLHKPSHKPSEQTDAVEFIFFTLQIFFKMENIKHTYKYHILIQRIKLLKFQIPFKTLSL